MALSDVSATGSLVERMQTFVPNTGGIVAEDKASGVIVVTEFAIMRCGELSDMQGGAAVVIGRKRRARCTMGSRWTRMWC